MHKNSLCLIILTIVNVVTSKSFPPRVNLGYSVYEGTAQSNGQNQFLGVRFAAAPLGDFRFRKPQPPVATYGVQRADAFGPICYAVGSSPGNGSEDCLFLNIWAPSDATPNSKLPVFFWIQGGGYNINANANYNGSDLVKSTNNQMVFVGLNYRVGPFGFLASEKVREDGDLNVGLLDQREALKWVQKHITKFGGDPDHVVIVGDSAGAGSVAMHLIAYNGRPTKLFSGAFGISPYFPTQMRVEELEWQFDIYAVRAGCNGTEDPLACLRDKDTDVLQIANAAMAFPGRKTPALFPFSPTVDGELIADFPYTMIQQGRFVKVPVVFGDDTNEGTIFVTNAASPEDVASFMRDQYPQLTAADTDAINAVYPLEAPSPQAPLPVHAPYFHSLSAAWAETTFICPGLLLSSAFAKYTKSWNYRYNVLTPAAITADIGSSHVSELPNVFGPGNTPAGSGTAGFEFDNIDLTPILQAYYTSFVRELDPNAYQVNGSVFWPQIDGRNQRLLLQVNATQIEIVPPSQLDRCAFWKGLAIKMEQ